MQSWGEGFLQGVGELFPSALNSLLMNCPLQGAQRLTSHGEIQPGRLPPYCCLQMVVSKNTFLLLHTGFEARSCFSFQKETCVAV